MPIRLRFRFQVDPDTIHAQNQAFFEVTEEEQSTKPALTITEAQAIPGDSNGDRRVNLVDYAALWTCLGGPDVDVFGACDIFDFTEDGDVDLEDVRDFGLYYTGP